MRFIGRGPQPLVSARSCLLIPIRQASLRVAIQVSGVSCLGFPEFTQFFNLPYGRKLQLGMDFSMAVGTEKLALSKLLSNPVPTPSVPLIRDPEIFFRGFEMKDL